ncbi:hypothetical protein GCM10020000_62600 [Streptomyces olivoverticillatus]
MRARGDRPHAAHLGAEHARLLRLLQQQGEDAVHIEREGVVRHRVREPLEERHVRAVRAELGVDGPQQAPAAVRERPGARRTQRRPQRTGQRVPAVHQLRLQRGQSGCDPRLGRGGARRGLVVHVDGPGAAEQHGMQSRHEESPWRKANGGAESGRTGLIGRGEGSTPRSRPPHGDPNERPIKAASELTALRAPPAPPSRNPR